MSFKDKVFVFRYETQRTLEMNLTELTKEGLTKKTSHCQGQVPATSVQARSCLGLLSSLSNCLNPG